MRDKVGPANPARRQEGGGGLKGYGAGSKGAVSSLKNSAEGPGGSQVTVKGRRLAKQSNRGQKKLYTKTKRGNT